MDDETIVERLTEIRGIGRWTVEMLLIFTLHRPDVLPVTDLGVRRGFMVCQGSASCRSRPNCSRTGRSGAPGAASQAGTCGGRASFEDGDVLNVTMVVTMV